MFMMNENMKKYDNNTKNKNFYEFFLEREESLYLKAKKRVNF